MEMPQDSMTTSYKMAEKSRMLHINCEILGAQVHETSLSLQSLYLAQGCLKLNASPMSAAELEALTREMHSILRGALPSPLINSLIWHFPKCGPSTASTIVG